MKNSLCESKKTLLKKNVEVFVKEKYTKMSRLKADSMNSTLCWHVFCFLSKLKGQNHACNTLMPVTHCIQNITGRPGKTIT